MAEQGPADQTVGKEGKVQTMEAGRGGLRRVLGCCMGIQRCDQESQGVTELGGTEHCFLPNSSREVCSDKENLR